ncbi:11612_t:CDS:2 [Racocetra fulgida]|uniref:11612_t:CDS:1 n=1 Tax=Racocetra fulgida TaxID=60492 RepID=A0A9N8VIH6_9GLOM|nr:11612_t:CDS:2 [Racocetra fulgida]
MLALKASRTDKFSIRIDLNGEVENKDRTEQKQNSTVIEGQNSGWKHDFVYSFKLQSKVCQVGFGEVVGDAFLKDKKKRRNDLYKILKETDVESGSSSFGQFKT